MAKHEPPVNLYPEPPFEPITAEAARQSDGLVWWRPDGDTSLNNQDRVYSDKDACLVRRG
jgi:hypothetical protein